MVRYPIILQRISFKYQDGVTPKKAAGVHGIDTLSTVHAQLILLMKALGASNVSAIHTPSSSYDSDVGGRTIGDYQVGNLFAYRQNEQANYVNNFQRPNNPYLNTYNPDGGTTQISLRATIT